MAQAKLILDYVQDHETALADQVYLTQPIGGGQVKDYTWRQVMNEARRFPTQARVVQHRNQAVAVAIERGGLRSVEGGSTRMVVVGDSDFLDNRVIDHSINRDFVGNAINWLVDRPRLVGIAPQPMRELIFSMTDSQARSMRLILLAAVPGGILAFGLLVWFRRQS